MEFLLELATLVGGITALWFIYEKRHLIMLFIRFRKKEFSSPHELPISLYEMLDKIKKTKQIWYQPITKEEVKLCKSLTICGFLIKRDKRTYSPYKSERVSNRYLK